MQEDKSNQKTRGRDKGRPFKGSVADFVNKMLKGMPISIFKLISCLPEAKNIQIVSGGEKIRVEMTDDEKIGSFRTEYKFLETSTEDEVISVMEVAKKMDPPKYQNLTTKLMDNGGINFQQLVGSLITDENGKIFSVDKEILLGDYIVEFKNVETSFNAPINKLLDSIFERTKTQLKSNFLKLPIPETSVKE